MGFLSVSLQKDVARLRRDPFSLLTATGIPLVLAVMMSLVFGRDPATPHGRLLVDDEDRTIASGHLLDAFRDRQLAQMVTVEFVNRDIGRARIDSGDASAFLIVPAGFQQAFFSDQPYRLQLFTNPSEQIVPQVVEQALNMTADATFYVRRGIPYRPANSTIGLQSDVVRQRRRSINFAAAFLPSMLFMGMLFIANSMAVDIWKEKANGTLRRLASSPVPLGAYLAARLLFVVLIYAVVSLVGMVAAQRIAGMPVPNMAAAVAWTTFTGTIFYLLFQWLTTLASNQRSAAVLSNLIIFPAAMLGGCFFPFEWMPAWMASVGRLTPNGWAITQFKAILDGSAGVGQIAGATALLTAAGAAAFFLARRRLQAGFVL